MIANGTRSATEIQKTSGDSSSTRVLFVDDERFVLESLRRVLRGTFDATFAEGGKAALELLRDPGVEPFAVVCTDMRMPDVDGVAVLKAFREEAPSTTRLLLTGETDLTAAVGAVNDGNIFRFLLKPTEIEDLKAAVTDAAEVHRLHEAEKELLERTLKGSINALIETLGLASPVAFTRALRVQKTVRSLLRYLKLPNQWEIEIAAMLSQVGAVTLPLALCERMNRGVPLDRRELEMLEQLPFLAERLLAGIPRLEGVREIILGQQQWRRDETPIGSKVLVLASKYDSLHERGLDKDVIAQNIAADFSDYGPRLVIAFNAMLKAVPDAPPVVLLQSKDLHAGMVLAADVKTRDGVLLVGRGQTVTENLIARIQNLEESVGLEESSVAVYDTITLS